MKKSTQPWRVVTRFAPLFLLVGVSLTGALVFPQSASAYHKTNRPDIERGLRENDGGGWIVLYSKELSQEEETKLSAAIAADVLGGSGGFTALYFEEFTRNSVLQVMSEARTKAPQIASTLQRELTVEKLSSAIKASFNGSRVELSMAGTTLQVGRATYNRAECERILLLGEKCLPTPNTYQPYIRFRVSASSIPSSNGRQISSFVGTCFDAAAESWTRERGTLQLYNCNGSPNQQWNFSQGRLIINTPVGSKCLDAAAESWARERGTLQLYNCNGSPNQQWNFSQGRLIINTPIESKCLDAAAETINSQRGTLQLYSCNGSPNQQWSFR